MADKSMLLFIGGAARTGKGILVRRLLTERQMPYLNLDVLKMGLTRGVPEYDIDPNSGAMEVGDKIWSLVREMSMSLLFDRVNYVFEGELLPRHVATLQEEFPTRVKACFLGYAKIDPAQKLDEIRMYGGYPNDWAVDYSDTDLLKIIVREIEFSQYLVDECAKHNLPYFDISQNFLKTLDEVVAFVSEQ